MMSVDEYNATVLSGGVDDLGLAFGNNPNLGLVDELGLGLNNLYLDDFSAVDWNADLGNGLPLTLAGADSGFGFNEDFVQLPFLGDLGDWQQGFGGLGESEFGPELGQKYLQNYQDEDEDDYRQHRSRRHRRDKRGKRDKRRHGVTPRADGPGYYDSPQNEGPPPEAPPPPAVASSAACSRSDVRGPDAGGPPDADEVASSASSHSSASSASSHSSADTPVQQEPQQPQRGRSKDRKCKCTKKDARCDQKPAGKSSHRRRRTPEDFYRVEQARRISPKREPPSYDTYQRFYRRHRSVSPGESVSTRSSSADSSSTVRSSRIGEPIRRSKLYKAARKCTADYLTRLKIQAPYDRASGPWVTAVSDVFVRMGFTIVDCQLEKQGGIITILAPPQLVGNEIVNLPWQIQSAITSIRAARVCRKNGKYDLQVW